MIYAIEYIVGTENGKLEMELDPTLTVKEMVGKVRTELKKKGINMTAESVTMDEEMDGKAFLKGHGETITITADVPKKRGKAEEKADKPRVPSKTKNPGAFFAHNARLALEEKYKECDPQWLYENIDKIDAVNKRLKGGPSFT